MNSICLFFFVCYIRSTIAEVLSLCGEFPFRPWTRLSVKIDKGSVHASLTSHFELVNREIVTTLNNGSFELDGHSFALDPAQRVAQLKGFPEGYWLTDRCPRSVRPLCFYRNKTSTVPYYIAGYTGDSRDQVVGVSPFNDWANDERKVDRVVDNQVFIEGFTPFGHNATHMFLMGDPKVVLNQNDRCTFEYMNNLKRDLGILSGTKCLARNRFSGKLVTFEFFAGFTYNFNGVKRSWEPPFYEQGVYIAISIPEVDILKFDITAGYPALADNYQVRCVYALQGGENRHF